MPITRFRASSADTAVNTTFEFIYPRISLFSDITASALIGDFWFMIGNANTRLFRYENDGVIEQINVSATLTDTIGMIGANDNLIVSTLGGGGA